MGVNAIGSFMKNISRNANLDAVYTNHCVRVTVVSTLKDKGLESNDIAAVTGHKNIQSVEKYVRRKSDTQKRSVSQMLSSSLESSSWESHDDRNPSTSINTITQVSQMQTTQIEQIRINSNDNYAFTGNKNKKTKIGANAETNVITITFN